MTLTSKDTNVKSTEMCTRDLFWGIIYVGMNSFRDILNERKQYLFKKFNKKGNK